MNIVLCLAIASIALAGAAVVMLVLRRCRAREPAPAAGRLRLPLPMRMVTPLALLMEPCVECFIPPRWAAATTRRLEALGIGMIPASRWHALRLAQGVAWGAVAGLAFGSVPWALLPGAAGYLHGGLWLRQQRELLERAIVRDLPAWLDLMTVCVEAGATLTSGLRLIVSQAPESPLREYFERVLREVRGGRARAQAFSHAAAIYGVESLDTLASALAHAEGSGMSLGTVLRNQAAQRTAERFARAEKLAMQAPVKMLGPLILCIFPCTFIVIGVPIAVRLGQALGT
ncbi:MAG TPA: type II secretion system F family protein [Steroidobacteraceae bacterium]|nr:type II secretion system F family protein [Steroidobacteraceae bacterium]